MSQSRTSLYGRISSILESARVRVARSINYAQVAANWLIGREIVEHEQSGQHKAGYGRSLLEKLSRQLTANFGNGYSVDNLELFRRFYLGYPDLISDAVRRKLPSSAALQLVPAHMPGDWTPGRFTANLSWLHYRALLRVESIKARCFYEIEAIKNCWSGRELERQINSLLFERLARSRDKNAVMRLSTNGQEIQSPSDLFKEPMVMEFLGLPETKALVESDLEEALLDNLQAFLLELGKGFAFVARQQRITLNGDHFYIDLVFYHVVLKCYILVDLKVGKLTHDDLGQLQLYTNYYDREKRGPGDARTLGLILCTDKNDAVVKYTLGDGGTERIFTPRYRLHIPTEDELKVEVQRELQEFDRPRKSRKSGRARRGRRRNR